MPSSPSKPFSGRARVASLPGGCVFTLRTEAVLSAATPVPIEAIDPNPRNPRRTIARDEAFAELVESIRQHGLLQPILVRRDGVRRILIAGDRRLAAIQQLASDAPDDPRWRKVLAVERTVSEDEAFVLALVENLQRQDLDAQDEAAALEALEHQLGSLQAVADVISRSKAYVSRRIRTYQDPVLAAAVLEQGLKPTTAQELLPVKDPRQRQDLVENALREGWDAPRARAAVKERCESQQPSAASREGGAADGRRRADAALAQRVSQLRAELEAHPFASMSRDLAAEIRGLHDCLVAKIDQLPL